MAVDLLWVEENLCNLLQNNKISIEEYNNFYDSLIEDSDGNIEEQEKKHG